ncbi:MAG: flippase-like domain-containing protein [Chloroflexi bacterium]|nr:flippase-like domain-containing protein [Chloroflexota bacterium]
MRKHLSTLLKIGVTVVGIILIATKMDLSQIAAVLVKINWAWFALALGLVTASLFLRAYRWQLLLRGLGVHAPFKRLANLYFVGNFFNAFLPSGFGGDVMRVVEAARNIPVGVAAGTVLVDRLTGLLMLFVMGLLALPFRPDSFSAEQTWIVAAVSVLGLIAGFVLLEGSLIRRFGDWLPGKLSPVGDGPIAQVLAAVQGCGWTAVFQALAVSTLFNLTLTAWWWMAGIALGFQISYGYYLLVIPILSITLLVPSISGLGVRENIAPFLFAPAGLIGEEAAALSLLVFLLMRIASLFGAPVYVISHLRQNKKETAKPISEQTLKM